MDIESLLQDAARTPSQLGFVSLCRNLNVLRVVGKLPDDFDAVVFPRFDELLSMWPMEMRPCELDWVSTYLAEPDSPKGRFHGRLILLSGRFPGVEWDQSAVFLALLTQLEVQFGVRATIRRLMFWDWPRTPPRWPEARLPHTLAVEAQPWPNLWDSGIFRRVQAIDLITGVSVDPYSVTFGLFEPTIWDCPNLRTIHSEMHRFDEEGAKQLALSKLPSLRFLHLAIASGDAIAPVLSAPWFSGVTHLYLEIGDFAFDADEDGPRMVATLRHLAAAPTAQSLRHVILYADHEGVIAPEQLAVPLFANVEVLHLFDELFEDPGVAVEALMADATLSSVQTITHDRDLDGIWRDWTADEMVWGEETLVAWSCDPRLAEPR
ncbi:MAG: hypothetical protein AAFV53_27670 [Myxococcota bacterium]